MRAASLSANAERRTVIRRFGGVDFRAHDTKTALSRSPDMKNMICEQNDFLVKRTGWKTQSQYHGACIYGLFALPDGSGLAIHAGSQLYARSDDGAQTLLCSDMNTAFSQSFVMRGVLYLLDGLTYRAVRRNAHTHAWETAPVREHAFVPATTISALPTGGGQPYEAVNLLSPKRINTFVGDGISTQFQLDATQLDASPVTATVGGISATVSAVNHAAGLVTLAAPPPNSNGLANVVITFSKTVPTHTACIDKCRFAGLYGGKNDTRAFLSGNAEQCNCDWQSGLYDPTYFPDTGYTRMGTDASAIVGYLRQYDSQLVIKTSGAQEASSFLRTYRMAEDGSAQYPLRQGAQGAGALAPRSFAILADLPVFLSAEGVMGAYGTAVAEQRTLRTISDAVTPRLMTEPNLKDACAIVHDGKYYLALNGNIYIADSRLSEENGQPAWFFWDHVPAVSLATLHGRLWFGTADGRLCRFLSPSEEDAYRDDEVGVCAYWRSPTLSLSQWGRVSCVRDVIPTLMPYSRSGVQIVYQTEHGDIPVLTRNIDLFSFLTVDFSRFSFRCIPSAVSCRTRKRAHKTPQFAVRIGNDRIDEPFGLLAVTIVWTGGRYVL